MSTVAEMLDQFWREIAARPDGPLAFRFYLQPAMSLALALRDGIKDARNGEDPYLWRILHVPGERGAAIRDGLAATGRVIGLGVGMDLGYQYLVLGRFAPFETGFVVLLLCFLPYLLLRGPIRRLASWWTEGAHS